MFLIKSMQQNGEVFFQLQDRLPLPKELKSLALEKNQQLEVFDLNFKRPLKVYDSRYLTPQLPA